MATQSFAELMRSINNIRSKEERIKALSELNSFPVRTILQGAFDPRVEWDLPFGPVPYTPNTLPDQESTLVMEVKKFHIFAVNPNNNLTRNKKELLFVQMLEKLDARDAELVAMAKDKTFLKN